MIKTNNFIEKTYKINTPNKIISHAALKSKLKIKTLTLQNKISPALRNTIEPLVSSLFAPKRKYNFYTGSRKMYTKYNNRIEKVEAW